MLNYLWTGMLVLGFVIGAVTGHMRISEAVISSSQDAVQLCITMLGVMAMWTGVLKIAEKSGLLEKSFHVASAGIGTAFSGCSKGPSCRRIYCNKLRGEYSSDLDGRLPLPVFGQWNCWEN